MRVLWLGLLFSWVLSSCYTVRQAFYFNNLFNSRQKIEEVLEDSSVSAKVREKLEFSRKVLSFAKSQGLNAEGAYDYYIHLEKKDVSYVVQAAPRDKLKLITWWFPFTGAVPYLGYFEKSERDEKAEDLAQKYDVHRGKVGAFSSLGWFEDPIYTPMMRRSNPDFAHLLLHELVHRTFWSKGSVKFNENLAEFGAEILTEIFLKEQGRHDIVKIYHGRRLDMAKYRGWLREFRASLKAIYQDKNLSKSQKLTIKEDVIARYTSAGLPDFSNPAFLKLIKKKRWNNASILAASLYTPDTERFQAAYLCLGRPPIGEFLQAIRQSEQSAQSSFEALDSLCSANEEIHE